MGGPDPLASLSQAVFRPPFLPVGVCRNPLGTCQTADGWLVDPTKGWPQGPHGPPSVWGGEIHSREGYTIGNIGNIS